MGKKLRKKKRKNRNKKLRQHEEINAISKQIESNWCRWTPGQAHGRQGRCLCLVPRLVQAVTLAPSLWHLRGSNNARGSWPCTNAQLVPRVVEAILAPRP
ncbi:hypothetical protein V6N13_142574 [Hibiscus sabdariffa]|uniref:Uncharacterized protein n=1 Tax=Hibiscus sabdariffa TaxID=183260 RepID=A0ABR2FEN1_9ROSI